MNAHLTSSTFFTDLVDTLFENMPGTSRVPVSLRNLSSVKEAAVRRNPTVIFNIEL